MTNISQDQSAADRIARLERKLRRTQGAFAGCVAVAAVAMLFGFDDAKSDVLDVGTLRAHCVEVVDDQDVVRISLGQDAEDTQRRSRAASVLLFDRHGDERGGFGTFDDDSVVFAMDAPRGVGASMRDRLGLSVNAKGGSQILLIDNRTRGVVGMYSDGEGGGGVHLMKWDMDARDVAIKSIGFRR